MAAYGATLLRLVLGVVYLMHAYLVVVQFGPAGMVAYQAKHGIPYPELATGYLILAHGEPGIAVLELGGQSLPGVARGGIHAPERSGGP